MGSVGGSSQPAAHGGLVLPPPATMFAAGAAPSTPLLSTATVVPPPAVVLHAVVPTLIRDRGRPKAKANSVPASDKNNKNAPSKKTPTAAVTGKRSPDKVSTGGTGLLPASIASLTSGMCSSAALLIQNAMDESNNCDIPPSEDTPKIDGCTYHGSDGKLTSEQKKKTSRDRNREHARCTRLRKKAYLNKLKELVDGLHTERNEDSRKRRVAVQQLAELQNLRRKVVHTFLDYHCKFEGDYTKWAMILECGHGNASLSSNDGSTKEEFWLKQPVTPYRSFRRSEVQKGSRILRGIDAMIRDSASMSVMIETIGSRNLSWLHRKRDDFLTRNYSQYTLALRSCGADGTMMQHVLRPNDQLGYRISSLSSNSGSSTGIGSGSDKEFWLAQLRKTPGKGDSSSSEEVRQELLRDQHHGASNDLHDYNAPSLLDPLPEPGTSVLSGSGCIDSDNCVVSKDEERVNGLTDGPDPNPTKKRKMRNDSNQGSAPAKAARAVSPPAKCRLNSLPRNIARSGGIVHNVKAVVPLLTTVPSAKPSATTNNSSLSNGKTNLSRAPAVPLPPFVGIGKKKPPEVKLHSNTLSALSSLVTNGAITEKIGESILVDQSDMSATSSKPAAIATTSPPPQPPVAHSPSKENGSVINHGNDDVCSPNHYNSKSKSSSNANVITIDNDTSDYSQSSSQNQLDIQAHYHINEDDMILTDDVLMCPFIFRSQQAVWCGALAECVQPGMLRACFSSTNKLCNVEMIFDAMGFCQQLERASGNEGMAQIIPNSLEMALAPNSEEARVITLAEPPFKIVSINEVWTSITGYTQVDAEGKDLSILYGDRTDKRTGLRNGMPQHDFANVARGMCAASTNVHYDKNGQEFLNFMCSYPLSNLSNKVTHLLHVCKELPPRT